MDHASDLEAAGRAYREASAHPPRIARDPASDMRGGLRASTEAYAAEVRGADPAVDAAIKDLIALESSAELELEAIARLADDVARERKPKEALREKVENVADEAERRLAKLKPVSETALEKAREAIISTLLPEPALDTATQLKTATIEKLLKAHKPESSPTGAFEAVFRDLEGRGDRLGIAILLGEWGRATYLEVGGDPKGWADVRRAFARIAAEGSLKESPVAKRLRVLYSPAAGKAAALARAGADGAVKKLITERDRLKYGSSSR